MGSGDVWRRFRIAAQFDVIVRSALCWEMGPVSAGSDAIGFTKEICYPSSNPFYLNCQLHGKSDYCLVLLNSCLAKVGRSEEAALLEPHLQMPFNKRSFRNGVGSGIKKTSFRRAKS
ncbi:hypothetical protein CIB84_005219 [Bambusicola thoracicus]|uniref:Neuropeptide S n=1 Tax=Bambusicola thoracicus TaxID=9083 RepID=A0A2P4T3U0_BAMTH|nr:hypothetical protein CIB84_005219 [Bambusicola thoracicus]